MQEEHTEDQVGREPRGRSSLCKGLGRQEARRAGGGPTTLSPGTDYIAELDFSPGVKGSQGRV